MHRRQAVLLTCAVSIPLCATAVVAGTDPGETASKGSITDVFAASPRCETGYEKELLQLLILKEYETLDARLRSYQEAYEADFREEPTIARAFGTFWRPAPALTAYLDDWVTQHPRSYAALMARANHRAAMGWATRGEAFFKDTPKEQIEGMWSYFEQASSDVTRALQLNPRLAHAYSILIDIDRNVQGGGRQRPLVKRALEINPYSLSVRWNYLGSLLPRWGGSVEAMEAFVEEARPYYDEYPRLRVLDGRVDAEKGDTAATDLEALSLYDRALSHGEIYYYVYNRGRVLYGLDRYDEAIRDFDRALQLMKGSLTLSHQRLLGWRGYSHVQVGEFENAVEDLSCAIDIAPKAWLFNARGKAHFGLDDYDLAAADFEKALELAPDFPLLKKNWKRALKAAKRSRQRD